MRLYALVLWITVAMPAFGAVIVSSTFDDPFQGVDGWSVAGDGNGPTYVPAGGNPDGYISTTDQAGGSVAYWVAPSKFLGNMFAGFGGAITFDLSQNISGSQFVDSNPLVRLIGNGTVLSYAGSGPGTSFTSYVVPLVASAGWISGGVSASDAQLQNALANLTDFRIRAEFAFVPGDVNGLDNVAINAVPEPGTAVVWLAAPALAAMRRARGRA